MNAGPRGWNPQTSEEIEAEKKRVSATEEWSRLHATVFGSGPGRELLEKYHGFYVEAHAGPEASEAMLRHLDAKRALIIEIERLTVRGLTKPKLTT